MNESGVPELGPDPDAEAVGEPPGRPAASRRLIWFIAVLAVCNICYRLVLHTGWFRTGALYVGIPAILAIGLVLMPSSRSALSQALRGATLALLIAAVILPEGIICLLMAAPIVYLVAVSVGGGTDMARRRGMPPSRSLPIMVVPLLVLSLEGVVGSPVDPRAVATATRLVVASPTEVEAALARPAVFATDLPAFLRMGFNEPVAATGAGLAVGDTRSIEFTGGTHDDHPMRLFGGTGERSVDHRSSMHLTVSESSPGRVVFAVAHDGTMLSRWVRLDRSVVTWHGNADGTTTMTWSLEYERLLSPAAYFGPLQQYGLTESAAYLLASVDVQPAP